MNFQIGSMYVQVGLRDENGKKAGIAIVLPISSGCMLAIRAQISNDEIPLSSSQAVYKKGNKFAEEMVRGWLYDAS